LVPCLRDLSNTVDEVWGWDLSVIAEYRPETVVSSGSELSNGCSYLFHNSDELPRDLLRQLA
jgi:hypothetical protein